MRTMPPSDDPYLLANGTLRNKLGITDPAQLALVEGNLSAVRARDIELALPRPPFSFETLRDVHRTLFQDVYDWAGQPRLTSLAKREFDDPRSPIQAFTPPETIQIRAEQAFARLAGRSNLTGLDPGAFAAGAAELFTELNAIHFAREGNGRTNRLLMSAIASNAGHTLDFNIVTHERMVAVSVQAHKGDPSGVTRMFEEMLDPRQLDAMRKATTFLKTTAVPWNDIYIATTRAGQDYKGVLVQQAGSDFMMRVDTGRDSRILIGDAADLKPGQASGSAVDIRATQFASAPAASAAPVSPMAARLQALRDAEAAEKAASAPKPEPEKPAAAPGARSRSSNEPGF